MVGLWPTTITEPTCVVEGVQLLEHVLGRGAS